MELPPDTILDVARRAGLQPRKIGQQEWVVPCFDASVHRHGDAHPSCRLNAAKNTFFCDPCGRGGGVREFAEHHGVTVEAKPPTTRQAPPTTSGLLFEATVPVSAPLHEHFRVVLNKDYPASTWRAFGALEGRCYPAGVPDRTEDAVAFPLSSGGTHVYLYRRPDRKRRWRFAGGGKPDLLTAGLDRQGPILLCEGEWDAMRAHADGFAVATGTGGAGTWRPEWNDRLKGWEVIDIHDVDEAGRRGAEKVTASMVASGLTVRVVTLPVEGTADNNDLSDYRREHSVDDLRRVIAAATAVVPFQRPERASKHRVDVDQLVNESALGKLSAGASFGEVEEALREFCGHLLCADNVQRSLGREAAISKLKAIGLQAAARLVDAALEEPPDEQATSSSLVLEDPKPWPSAVNGTQLAGEIRTRFTRHLALVDGAAEALTLWVLYTYVFNEFFISPLLALVSPTKRCGKTTTLDLMGAMVPRCLPASNITPAALFRTVEAYHPTLLIDEADTFAVRNDELRGVLNSGHKRTFAVVIRTVGDNYEPKLFSTWCPKAIALIGRLPTTLEDRCIVIPMRRRAKGEVIERVHQERLDSELTPIRQKAARWTADHLAALRRARPGLPNTLNDRAQDNWRPLLAIAGLLGDDWPQRAARAAELLSETTEETDSTAVVQLLADLQELFAARGDRLTTGEILGVLHARDDRPWPEWSRGKPLSPRQLSKLLKPFGISSAQFKRGAEKCRGYLQADFTDTFSRYLGSNAVLPVPGNVLNNLDADPIRYPPQGGTGCEPDVSDCKHSKVPAVPAKDGDSLANAPSDDDWETFDL